MKEKKGMNKEMDEKMRKIFIYGAIDRFNYGDLLFPLILNEKLKRNGSLQLSYYGIIESNLSGLGALPSRSLKEFYRDCKQTENAVVIIAGGEVLQAPWGPVYSYLNPRFYKIYHFFRRVLRRYSLGLNNLIAKKLLGAKTMRPFVIDPDIFPQLKGVIYNSTGGISTKSYPQKITKALQKSLFISCRDEKTFKSLHPEVPQLKLFPDSAILMSTIFNERFLEEKTSGFRDFRGYDYIFFQVNKRIASGLGIKAIAGKLDELAFTTGRKIVLCPIGTALGHEDNMVLEQIYKEMQECRTILVTNPSIWDIMTLISNASLYIGSSLHGVITSMSFAIPYLSIGNLNKVNSYVDTWGVDELKGDTNFKNWDKKIIEALSMDHSVLQKNRDLQIRLSEKSMEEITRLL
ncbi:MAG: polysaccharide pyruvyl transferase family protein [Dysgonamonadaceae bacterium]|jgi:hypothetical protein|nr:polysaccharide pyruvyl transferase family protein [Dysgonamonadaceae bacterium]